MQKFHPAFPEASANLLDLAGSLAKRDLVGGVSHKRVSEALDTANRELEEEARALEDAGQHIEGSK
jgi:argininosuccinate lyase